MIIIITIIIIIIITIISCSHNNNDDDDDDDDDGDDDGDHDYDDNDEYCIYTQPSSANYSTTIRLLKKLYQEMASSKHRIMIIMSSIKL